MTHNRTSRESSGDSSKRKVTAAALQLPAGATGDEKRYLLGIPNGVQVELKLSEWVALLDLAKQNGWEPMGTRIGDVQYFVFMRTGKVMDVMPIGGIEAVAAAYGEANADWNGNYTEDMGQTIDDVDVRNMAAALEKALPTIADSKLRQFAKDIVDNAATMDTLAISGDNYADIRDNYLDDPRRELTSEDLLTTAEMNELVGLLKQDGWEMEVLLDKYLDLRFPKTPPATGSPTRMLYDGVKAQLEEYGAYKVGLPPLGLVTSPRNVWRMLKGT